MNWFRKRPPKTDGPFSPYEEEPKAKLPLERCVIKCYPVHYKTDRDYDQIKISKNYDELKNSFRDLRGGPGVKLSIFNYDTKKFCYLNMDQYRLITCERESDGE